MLAFPVAVSAALMTAAIILWGFGRWLPQLRSSLTLAGGTAAGHAGWVVMSELSVADPNAGMSEVLRSAVSTLATPREAGHWVVLILLLSSLVAGAVTVFQKHGVATMTDSRQHNIWRHVLVWAVIYSATLVRLLWGSVYLTRRWSPGVAVGMVAAHVVALLVILIASQPPSSPQFGAWRFLWITLAASAACGVIGMSGSAVYAQWLATGVASLLLCTVFRWRHRSGGIVEEWPVGMILLVVGIHLWLAHFYAELSLLDGALLLGSIAAGAVYGAGGESRSIWLTRVLPAVACVSFAVAAVGHSGLTLSRALANPTW